MVFFNVRNVLDFIFVDFIFNYEFTVNILCYCVKCCCVFCQDANRSLTSSTFLQPAQFIKLCNLHASVDKSGMAEAVEPEKPMLELILHSGTAFSRGLLILNPDSAEVSNLSRRMLRCSERESFCFATGIHHCQPSKLTCVLCHCLLWMDS